VRSVSSFDFLDWFTLAAAVWFIWHGAAGAWRRELSMFGHVAGKRWQGTARGPWAVLAGLAWVVLGGWCLYRVFGRVV